MLKTVLAWLLKAALKVKPGPRVPRID